MAYDPVSHLASRRPGVAVVPLPSGGIVAGERPDKDPWSGAACPGHRAVASGGPPAAAQQAGARLPGSVHRARRGVPAGAGLLARHRPDRAEHQQRHRHDQRRRQAENVVSLDGVPIGPTFTRHYFFGADTNGRDLAVRLLYGGRTSLIIGGVATADHHRLRHAASACCPGIFRGPVDAVLRPVHGADLVLPARHPRRRRRHRAGPRRDRPDQRQLDPHPGPDHRGDLHPLPGQADPRRGAAPA